MTLAMKKTPGPGASGHGFRANLTGASLIDLVQMECLARATQVVRVVSGDEVGYLYFESGAIVHAMSSSATGEPAALEILGWDGGSFEPCNAGWPNASTITRPWQALLLLAVTQRDEARRSTVVDFPRERSGSGTMIQKSEPPVSNATPNLTGIERAVRLEADGRVVSARGDAAELAEMTAYTMRLAALIGERLGMEGLRAVESVNGMTRRIFYADKNGGFIGLQASTDADLGVLREKLGL
jgi:hypothetical protein